MNAHATVVKSRWAEGAAEYHAERKQHEQAAGSSKGTSIDQEVERLAKLPPYAYDLVRERHAADLGIRVGTLDKAVAKCRKKLGLDTDHEAPPFAIIKPWGEPVDGATLLNDIARAVSSHVILPAGAATAVALWVLHAHAHDSAWISPLLVISSPAPECGKTTLLTFLGAVVPKPLPASNVTASVLFRAVEKWSPTLLVDEADTFLKDNEPLRGVIDSGHNKANAYTLRNVGENYEPKQFRTWSPKAVALIGRMHPALVSRCVHIEMRRKGRGEQIAELRPDRLGHLHVLAQKAARWAADNLDVLRMVEPEVPSWLAGRRADNWRHMLAIAELAGGTWPAAARSTAEVMVADDDNEVAGILLLLDIRNYFEVHKTDRVSSCDLAGVLQEMLDRPWPEWKSGKPITEAQVAKLLRNFKVKSRAIRIHGTVAKGYLEEQFKDAFTCYLSPQMPVTPSSPVTRLQVSDFNDLRGDGAVTQESDVTAPNPSNPLKNNNCNGVTAPRGENGKMEGCERLCAHCGDHAYPGSPLLMCSVHGEESWGHEDCLQQAWRHWPGTVELADQ